jgi:predicted MFS family arabinose efflux permease
MPQVRRRVTFELDAPAEILHDALAGTAGPSGPVRTRVELAPSGGDRRTRVTVTAEADGSVPFFAWFVRPALAVAMRRELRHARATLTAAAAGRPPPGPRRRSLLVPPTEFDDAQRRLLGAVSFAAALASFGSALFGQQLDSLASSFDVSNDDLGVALAVTRLGVLAALVAAAVADRRGRRQVILAALCVVAVGNAVAALAPSLVVFTSAQVLVRAAVQAVLVVGGIAVVEEAPDRARAFSIAMLALASGAGFAVAVMLLPLSDFGSELWRVPFALSGLSIVAVPAVGRQLRETRRYRAVAARTIRRGRIGEVLDATYRRRFLLLAALGFLTNVFSAPSAQFTNRYLLDERGFSNAGVAAFRGVTAGVPGFFGILLGGYLAEARGRRPVAVLAITVSTLCTMVFFLADGPLLWVMATVAIVAAAPATLAVGTMDAELFPTEARGTSNAGLLAAYVSGSVVGLLLAGSLADPLGGLGRAVALCGVAPLLAAAFLVWRLPEPSGRRLEDVSPSEE